MPKPAAATMPKEVSHPSSMQTGTATTTVADKSPKTHPPEKPAPPLSPEARTATDIAAASHGKVLPPPRRKLPSRSIRINKAKLSDKAMTNPKKAEKATIDPTSHPRLIPKNPMG